MPTTEVPRSKSPAAPARMIRCAIYTRKSTDENLNTDFNSLDAQREAAEAYITSQRADGWIAIPERFDDPAFSAATTERPALQRLLADVEAGKVDAVVVYKIDRLSRSLRDFGKLMETFEKHNVAFVSVTQRFDTSSSMGKLTLNILMSFAEFEREVTRERILDKVAAAKRKGKHTGGVPILGYDTDRATKRLVVNPEEAKLVRRVFQRFVDLGSATKLAAELNSDGYRTKSWPTVSGKTFGGHAWNKAHVYRLLNNVKYVGLVEHRGKTYPGEHEALVTRALWDKAHAILETNHQAKGNAARNETPALLRGIIKCGVCGCSMGPTFTKKNGRTYRFYLCVQASKKGYSTCPVKSVSAGTIEEAVMAQLRVVFRSPELVAKTFREAKLREGEEIERLRIQGDEIAAGSIEAHALTESEVVDALRRLDPIWEELFPAERNRIVQLLLERVTVQPDGIELRIRGDGLRSLVTDLKAANSTEATPCP